MTFRSTAAIAAIALLPTGALADTLNTLPTGDGGPISTTHPYLGLTPLVQTGGFFNSLGEIRFFAGDYAPTGYARADGSLLNINDNEALFAKLGTTYGGDGITTFRLPDLVGRAVVGTGESYALGERMGSETVRLTDANLPAHSHGLDGGAGDTTGPTGAGVAYNNMMPGLALDYEINRFGIFPSRPLVDVTPQMAEFGEPQAFSEPYLSFVEIDAARDGAGGDADRELLPADGRLLPIAQNTALFSLMGTTFGGDGRTTFALPDMGDRIVTGTGRGPGLSERRDGQTLGSNTETLTVNEMPAHAHLDQEGSATSVTGGGQAENNLQAELSMTWVIATQGLFPSRDGGGAPGDIPYLGELALFAGNFAPRGFAKAQGQLLSITQNSALFSILGTTFGGDGRVTFALPDLRGRTPIGAGQSRVDAGTFIRFGERGGRETFTLTGAQLPSHSHSYDLPPVPLPAGVWLLLAGMGGLGGLAALRRRPA
jgi:microcystin-dependent protein